MIKIYKYGEVAPEEIFARPESTVNVEEVVADIIADVRKNGDRALKAYCEKFDGAKLKDLEVSAEEIEAAFGIVEPEFIDILKEAADNIRAFHQKQVRNSFVISEKRPDSTCPAAPRPTPLRS